MKPLSLEELLELDLERLNPEGLRIRLNELLDVAAQPSVGSALVRAQHQQLDRFRWDGYKRTAEPTDQESAYRFTHQKLLELAQISPPEPTKHRVSDFSGWVLNLYWRGKEESALAYGKQVERDVARLTPIAHNSDYELIYCDPLNEKPAALPISTLKINGKALVGAPDLVFQNRRSKDVVIVERKGSRRKLPGDGWPNAKAQLWAYSQIDRWKDAARMRVVQEVWGRNGTSAQVSLRQVLSWDARDQHFQQQNYELFEHYRRLASLI